MKTVRNCIAAHTAVRICWQYRAAGGRAGGRAQWRVGRQERTLRRVAGSPRTLWDDACTIARPGQRRAQDARPVGCVLNLGGASQWSRGALIVQRARALGTWGRVRGYVCTWWWRHGRAWPAHRHPVGAETWRATRYISGRAMAGGARCSMHDRAPPDMVKVHRARRSGTSATVPGRWLACSSQGIYPGDLGDCERMFVQYQTCSSRRFWAIWMVLWIHFIKYAQS